MGDRHDSRARRYDGRVPRPRASIATLSLILLLASACGDDGGETATSTAAGGEGGSSSPGSSAASGGGPSSSGSTTGSADVSSSASQASSSAAGGGSASSTGSGGSGEGGGEGGEGGGGAGGAGSGYGDISGSCGEIGARDVESPDPALFEGAIDFTGEPAIDEDDTSALTPGGQEIVAAGNLGGSSLWSEVFAFEVLARCEGAELVKTEGEIVYAVEGKKTDILVAIDGLKVGVSVVRAVGFPPEDPYPVEAALPVLEGKLDDILQSSANVAPEDAWEKQILSVIAYSEEHAASIANAWELLDDGTRADTVVVVTVTDGDDDFIYFGD
jgi:hypothetical protein